MNPASSTKACAWREPGASRVRITESGSTTACPSEGGLLQALCPTGRQCKPRLSGKEAEVSSYPHSRLDRVCGGGGQELLEVDLFIRVHNAEFQGQKEYRGRGCSCLACG